MKKLLSKTKPCLIFFILFILWVVLTECRIVNSYFLPSPFVCIKTFFSMIKSGELLIAICISTKRVFIGMVISLFLSLFCSIISVFFKKVSEFFSLFSSFIRLVPPLSLLPLFIMLFGIGEETKILVITLSSFFPLNLSFTSAFESIDKGFVDVAKNFGFSKIETFFKVYVPLSYKNMLSGIKTGITYAWRSLVGVEVFSSFSGLGFIIQDASLTHSMPRLFVGIFTIALWGGLFEKLFSYLINRSFVKGE